MEASIGRWRGVMDPPLPLLSSTSLFFRPPSGFPDFIASETRWKWSAPVVAGQYTYYELALSQLSNSQASDQ